jgi:RNA polymerase sigma-70 factor, ECF subfamily
MQMQQERLDRFEAWLIHHKAKQLVGKRGFTESDLADIKQDLTLDLLVRLKTFDPSRAKRHTFVAMVVEHRVAAIIEHRVAARRDGRREECSLNDSVSDHEGKIVERHETLDADCRGRGHSKSRDMAVDVQAAIASLPPRLQVLCSHLQTKTIAEVARELGVPRMTLYGDIKRLKAAFEEAGLGDYLPGE